MNMCIYIAPYKQKSSEALPTELIQRHWQAVATRLVYGSCKSANLESNRLHGHKEFVVFSQCISSVGTACCTCCVPRLYCATGVCNKCTTSALLLSSLSLLYYYCF